MRGLSDSAYKNTSIHDGLTWSEIIPVKKLLINKNDGQGDSVIAYILKSSRAWVVRRPTRYYEIKLQKIVM